MLVREGAGRLAAKAGCDNYRGKWFTLVGGSGNETTSNGPKYTPDTTRVGTRRPFDPLFWPSGNGSGKPLGGMCASRTRPTTHVPRTPPGRRRRHLRGGEPWGRAAVRNLANLGRFGCAIVRVAHSRRGFRTTVGP